jgi:hypothetical protein
MRKKAIYDDVMRLLGRVLAAGAVVERAGRALVRADAPGPVVPRDRGGSWPSFAAPEPGFYVCCPLWFDAPAAILAPGCRGWLRLGDQDELPELLSVAEWLASLDRAALRGFCVGLLHGLGRLADGWALPDQVGARPVIRGPDTLAGELFG